MASQADVHDLLRLLTTGRNKLSMMAAMGRVKALQEAGLRKSGSNASLLDMISNISLVYPLYLLLISPL
jgi:hypothetical protein